jgi:Leucine-rich repeat (LRR) protein
MWVMATTISNPDAGTPTTRSPRGGWLRFSLRSLLVLVTLLAMGLGWFAYWREGKRREAAAGDWVLNHGGSIAESNGREMAHPPLWVRWLGPVLPEECLRTVHFVDFLEDPTDADLKVLRDLPNLKQLNLNHAKNITPAGLAPLAELPKLEVLYLMNTPVGDTGLAQVRNLHGLKEIWVVHTGITDASMPWITSNPKLTHLGAAGARITDQSAPLLARLENLEVLSLVDTQITSRGLADIAKLPRLKHLYLLRTAVDDEGLKHLETTKSLDTLDIRLTRTTAAGRERFQRAMPGCRLEGF